MRTLHFAALAIVAFAACGVRDPGQVATPVVAGVRDAGPAFDAGPIVYTDCGPVSWSRQIQPIVQTYCLNCHASPPLYGAPHSLATYADTQMSSVETPGQKEALSMDEEVTSGDMPPNNFRPSAAEISLIQQWVAAGSPEDECPGTDAGMYDAGPPPDSGSIDLTGAAFEGTANHFLVDADAGQDDNLYRCFPFTLPLEDGGSRNLTEFAPVVDNKSILHHMIVYRLPTGGSPTAPYDCFGGPIGGTPQFVYGWAPGGDTFTFPSDVGFKVKSTDQFVLQIHYHNFTGADQTDSSGVAMWWTQDARAHQAYVVRTGREPFTIPANTADAEIDGVCTVESDSPTLHVFAALPHMHTLGTTISATIDYTDGGTDPLVSVNPWSFDNQRAYLVEKTLHAGDVIKTACHYDTAGIMSPVNYGEETENEMCYDFLYMYPDVAVPDGLFPGACMH